MSRKLPCRALAGLTVLVLASASASAARFEPNLPDGPDGFVSPNPWILASYTQSGTESASVSEHRALLDSYCVICHNERTRAGGLTLDTMDVSQVGQSTDVWEKVVRKLRAGMMPPPGLPRPDGPAHGAFVSWLEAELDRTARARPNPGRTETFHRLNRTEYQNAVRDLLALDVDVTTLLPTDDAGYGFDNIAGVLKLSQSLMERYLSAARKISRVAVGSPQPPAATTFPISTDRLQYERVEGLPFGTRGGIFIPKFNFSRDGEYSFRAALTCALVETAGCDPVVGFDDEHQLEVLVDGDRVHLFTLERKPRGSRGFNAKGEAQTTLDTRWTVRVPVKAGMRDVGVTFLKLPSYETSDYARLRFESPSYEGNMVPEGLGVYQPYLASVTITGPFQPIGGPGDTPSRRRIFACVAERPADEAPCARHILSTLARRAYRRPVADADVQALLRFYDDGRSGDGNFESGIEMALRALLVSPDFLFRMEFDPEAKSGASLTSGSARPTPALSTYRLSDFELASRLSFFLWSSIPDDDLLNLAEQGKLNDPAVLEQQVRRMLADPRSAALSTNFLPQWLQLRGIEFVAPADPDFDESLRAAMRTETELFFDSIVREDRPALELLTADYTFLNERLAWHYQIPHVKGSHFRRVPLSDDNPRRGLLGHGSVLTVTSHAIRTSPVKRGKWILESIMGVSPPPPPPNVPELEEKEPGEDKPKSMRERMASHRANPTCAGCHSLIDPIGFALENFDPTGKWRAVDASASLIDASGSFPDGTQFGNLTQFRAALVSQPERFVASLTERLLTYALGRGLESFDMPVVRAVTRDAADKDYQFSSLILGIVQSVPFQMRSFSVPSPSDIVAVRP